MITHFIPDDVRWQMSLNLLITLPLLLALSILFGDHYVDIFLPLYHVVLDFALPGFEVVQISRSHANGESVVAATVLAVRDQVVGGHTAPAGFSIDASTLAAHAGKHVVLLLLVPMLWPGLKFSQRWFCSAVACLMLPMLEALDIPLVLAGAVCDLLEMSLAPDMASRSWLVHWVRVLDGGGRVVLPIALGIACVQMMRLIGPFKTSGKRMAQ